MTDDDLAKIVCRRCHMRFWVVKRRNVAVCPRCGEAPDDHTCDACGETYDPDADGVHRKYCPDCAEDYRDYMDAQAAADQPWLQGDRGR